MKRLSQICLMLLALTVAFAGCDSAKNAAKDAAGKATDAAKDVADKAKDQVADLANIDFGDFDMKGLQEKFTGITDGFKNVSADNVDGLTSKITDLTGAMDGMGIANLPGPAKTAVTGAIAKFGDSIKSAMAGISDEGILGKLKPVVDALMEKVGAFK